VDHLVLLATILKARPDQADRAIGMPQQQPAAIRGHGAGVERCHHMSPPEAFKLELFRATVRLHRTPRIRQVSYLPPLSQILGADARPIARYPG
jgi:hypothetical protein